MKFLYLFLLVVSVNAQTYFNLPIQQTGQLGPAGTNLITYNIRLGTNVVFVTNSDGSMTISSSSSGGSSNIVSITTNGVLVVSSATNFNFVPLGGMGIVVSNTAGNILVLLSAPSTNGFVDASITNNLATIAYVQTSTNGFVDIRITNNLATLAYAQSLTNGFLKQFQILTNGVALGYVTNINWTGNGVTGILSGATAVLGISASGGSSGPTTNAPPYTIAINSGLGSTNILIDMQALGATNVVRATLTANVGVIFTNVIDGKFITLITIQDATGNRLISTNATWGFNTRVGTDITGLTLTTNAGYHDYTSFLGDGTNGVALGFVRGYVP